jgi:Cdc6-like AAA superfamily ATPase
MSTLKYTTNTHNYTKGAPMAEASRGEFEEKAFMLGTVFKPTTPISRENLFAGRRPQVRNVVDAINQQGQHAVLYGERGVGKTSLANMIFPKLRAPDCNIVAPLINCMASDTYSGVWKRVFEEIAFKADSEENGTVLEKPEKKLIKEYLGSYADDLTPDVVRRVLHGLGQRDIVVVILDEFDKLASREARAMMSDTLKFFSDRVVPATVVLIGVADDVETLIEDHRSLERCLKQVHMPRMSDDELESIVTTGLGIVGMTIDPKALDEIGRLSRGLPHYAHLLGLYSGRAALDKESLQISEGHVQHAVGEAIDNAQASIRSDYSDAITSSRKDALYEEVLSACALAQTDDLGWFYAGDVRPPLERILKKTYKVEAFARHLHAFCEDKRGPILIKDTKSSRPRFRFENPLMQPYVLIRGLRDKLISLADLEALKKRLHEPPEGYLF